MGVNILLAIGNAQPAVAFAGHFGAEVVLSAAGADARLSTLSFAYVAAGGLGFHARDSAENDEPAS